VPAPGPGAAEVLVDVHGIRMLFVRAPMSFAT
jgi:hypothetical protein